MKVKRKREKERRDKKWSVSLIYMRENNSFSMKDCFLSMMEATISQIPVTRRRRILKTKKFKAIKKVKLKA